MEQPITLKGFVKLCNFLVNSIYEGRKTESHPSKNHTKIILLEIYI